ncbi:MAG: hypothetical protein K2Q14_03565 [Gammaproteobacteria bacterium]|nr:hypothetical protein [Gammaproteobacteria bacterium]
MFNSSKESNVIMRVYQPSIPVDETKLPRIISGLMTDTSINQQKKVAKKKVVTKKTDT